MRTPHIPSMDQVRDEFIEAWAGDFVRGEIAAAQYFDQALNGHNLAIEAAAEQRGAIKALRHEADNLIGHGSVWPIESVAGVTAAARKLHRRADEMEGKNEQHLS